MRFLYCLGVLIAIVAIWFLIVYGVFLLLRLFFGG